MALKIALIDKNEIMQKMLSHCLHYFGADVHRFDGLEDFPAETLFDLIFIDRDMKTGGRPTALSVRARTGSTPVVILSRNGEEEEDPDLKSFPQAKKPIDGRRIRDLAAQLSPKAQGLKIHPFLKYPEEPEEEEEGFRQEKPPQEKELSLKNLNGAPSGAAEAQGPEAGADPASLQTAPLQTTQAAPKKPTLLKADSDEAGADGSATDRLPADRTRRQAAAGGLDLPSLSKEEEATFHLSLKNPPQKRTNAAAGEGQEKSYEATAVFNENSFLKNSANDEKQSGAGPATGVSGGGSASGPATSGSESDSGAVSEPGFGSGSGPGSGAGSGAEISPADKAAARDALIADKELTQTKTVLIENPLINSPDKTEETGLLQAQAATAGATATRPVADGAAENPAQRQATSRSAAALSRESATETNRLTANRTQTQAAAAPASHETKSGAGAPLSALKRDSIDLDESTKNDLGPAALVNTEQKDAEVGSLNDPALAASLKNLVKKTVQESAPALLREAVIEDNKSLIKNMLEKYSNTLEFEQTLSDALKNLGEDFIRKLFSNNAETIIRKSIEAYIESAHLKKFMANALRPLIQDSLKNHLQEGGAFSKDKLLPLVKEALEGEIKTLLDEPKNA